MIPLLKRLFYYNQAETKKENICLRPHPNSIITKFILKTI